MGEQNQQRGSARRAVETLLVWLPLLAGTALTELGARAAFAQGLGGLLAALWRAGIGDAWVAVAGAWFLACVGLVASGALLSLAWRKTRLAGGTVVPHAFLGADLDGTARYVPADDLAAAPVVVAQPSPGRGAAATSLGAIYRRHLLVADAEGTWHRLLALSTANTIWPLVLAPLVFLFALALAWGPLQVARDHVEPVGSWRTAELEVPLLLFQRYGLWAALGALALAALLLPAALRTGRWTREAYMRLGQPLDGEFPRVRPLPEAAVPGGRLSGRIVASRRRTADKARRRSDALYLVELAGPFAPPVRVGIRFRVTRNRRAFLDYLDERRKSGLPVDFDVVGAHDPVLVPRDGAGGPAPAGIADDIRQY